MYYLANELEDVLVVGIKDLVNNFSPRLLNRVRQTDHYREISRLLGKDAGIEIDLKQVEEDLSKALVSAAISECDSYVRESPRFYDEGTFSIHQFPQNLTANFPKL